MSWIKDALLDVLSLILIIIFSFTQNSTLEIIIWVYTGFLILSKVLYLSIGFLKKKADKTMVPNWFYHIIYFSSIVILVFAMNYYLASTWAIIWILSIIPLFKKTT